MGSFCFPTIHETRLTCVTSELLSLPRSIAAFPAAMSVLPVGGCVPRGARSRAALRSWTISAWCLGVVVEARARSRACGSRGVRTVTGVSRYRPQLRTEARFVPRTGAVEADHVRQRHEGARRRPQLMSVDGLQAWVH